VLAYAFAGLVGLPWASCRAWADAWDALFLPRVRPLASFPSCGARFSARASHAARLFVAVRGCDAPSLPAPSISVRCTWHRAVRWGASHEVARRVPFSVRRSRRAVRGYRPSGLSRSDVRLAGTAPTPSADSSLRFSAPRVFGDFNFDFVKTPPPRVIRDRFLSVHVPGPRGTVLATWPGPLARSRRRSWDLLTPFAVLLRFAGGRAPFPARPEPTCRFASDPPRDIRRAGSDRAMRSNHGFWPRLLGFRPANQPYRATRRPRYSFCAEGRSNSPATTALGLVASLGRSPPVRGLHF
jgi:hypothetical protein